LSAVFSKTCFSGRQTFLQASSLSLKRKGFYLLDNLVLPLVEEEFFIVIKVLLAAVAADEVSTAADAIIPK
jgi:hypothetical protein